MTGVVKNRGCVPNLSSEGTYTRPIGNPGDANWANGLSVYDRLFAHQTMASARKNSAFIPDVTKIPQDDLDFILQSVYNHSLSIFNQAGDELFQAETMGIPTWRRLKNSVDVPAAVKSTKMMHHGDYGAGHHRHQKSLVSYGNIVMGGIVERRHPMNIKLMNSSHHSPQTIGGYTRQDRDGTRFCY